MAGKAPGLSRGLSNRALRAQLPGRGRAPPGSPSRPPAPAPGPAARATARVPKRGAPGLGWGAERRRPLARRPLLQASVSRSVKREAGNPPSKPVCCQRREARGGLAKCLTRGLAGAALIIGRSGSQRDGKDDQEDAAGDCLLNHSWNPCAALS